VQLTSPQQQKASRNAAEAAEAVTAVEVVIVAGEVTDASKKEIPNGKSVLFRSDASQRLSKAAKR
jgi:hypothetical protein